MNHDQTRLNTNNHHRFICNSNIAVWQHVWDRNPARFLGTKSRKTKSSNEIKRRDISSYVTNLLGAVEEKKFKCGISTCQENACYSDELYNKGYKVFKYPQASFQLDSFLMALSANQISLKYISQSAREIENSKVR